MTILILAIALCVIIFGARLNSYGIDEGNFGITLIGWCLMVAGGIPWGWFSIVFLARLAGSSGG